MIENSYYEKYFSHDGKIVSENQKILSPAKTGVHASYIHIYTYLHILSHITVYGKLHKTVQMYHFE